MTRTRVRLLGPCFKTGRRGRRPTRDRGAARANGRDTRYTRPRFGRPAPRTAREATGSAANEGRRTSPSPTARGERDVASSAGEVQPRTRPAKATPPTRMAEHLGGRASSLNLRRQLREPLRLPLHSFTYS